MKELAEDEERMIERERQRNSLEELENAMANVALEEEASRTAAEIGDNVWKLFKKGKKNH